MMFPIATRNRCLITSSIISTRRSWSTSTSSRATGGPRDIAPFDYGSLRKRFKGAYIANNGYDVELAAKVLAANEADLIAFGKPFIANPDLVERFRSGAALNTPDKATFYGGG